MRQVAGLTAGSVMMLREGSFQFRESEKEVGFSLVVESADDVTVVGGTAAAVIDEIPVSEPTPLGNSVLNVGSACFTVREPRPEPTNAQRLADLEAGRTSPSAIPVPQFDGTHDEPVQAKSSRFGSLFSRNEEDGPAAFDAETWQFLEAIRDTRGLVADRHRKLHPDPEELHSRLSRMDPGLWDRTVEHPMFARFPIAFSTIPWEPRFDMPERIPETLYQPIQEMSCLPWVPITANLLFGPLGIVGGRSAVLSCARNAVLYLACLSSPHDIEFSIVTAQGLVEDWNWSSSLPNSLFPNGDSKYCVAVADGMTHFEGAGFSHESVKQNEMGLIVLAESVDDLPDYCGTVLELTPEGQCRVTNHLGEQVNGTPIGVTTNFAASLAGMVREAVGDGPEDEELEAQTDPNATATVTGPVSSTTGPAGQAAPAPRTEDADVWDEVPPIDDLIDLDGEEAIADDAIEFEDETVDEDQDDELAQRPKLAIAGEAGDPNIGEPVPGDPDSAPHNPAANLDSTTDVLEEEEEEDLDSLAEEVARAAAAAESQDSPS
jgi:hypothetical protein